MNSESIKLTDASALEKENRILRKKLARAEQTCLELERTNQKKESLLRQVIHELKDSQKEVAEKRQLELALKELKRTQSQLIQAEKMSSLGQLVAGLAHEINNPINFIYGNLTHALNYARDLLDFVHLYQECHPNPAAAVRDAAEDIELDFLQEDLPKILNSIKLGTERIRQIVLSLRNFSRMDEAEVKAVDIHEGLDSTLLILQHRLKARSDRPEIQVFRDYNQLPLVECYAGQLNQVFMNILANAIDALDENNLQQTYPEIKDNSNQITIQTSVVDSEWIKVAIADNGPGMPKRIKEQIFDPFFTTKPMGKGTGMGMSISHQIITEKHNGKLDCFSTPGEGTEFVMLIPIRQLACSITQCPS